MKKVSIILILFSIAFVAWAQSPKREFRATWLATVWSLDWPKTAKISSTGNEKQIAAQKTEMIRILDSLYTANMNAVFFQVRSRCDAMYNSKFEPWSTDLVSVRGMDPGYDPLAFVVEEAHKRGIEVHAWMNPYRFESSISQGSWSGQAGDYAESNPDWVLRVGDASILNPALPEVRQRITDIVDDIITKYDIDGIVFDDYFYLQGIKTEDAAEQEKYNTTGMPVADWRRGNVNRMIAQVYNKLQEKKPYLRFGVSPAGVYDAGQAVTDSYGVKNTPITAGYAYNGIYCDPLAWLQEGTVDYISPQIYWTIDSNNDYRRLSEWWSYIGHHFSRHFYSSHTLSGMGTTATQALKVKISDEEVPVTSLSGIERESVMQLQEVTTRAFGFNEIGNQIQCNRDYDVNDAPGSVFYSTLKFYTTKGFIENIRQSHFSAKALPPAIFWKDHDSYEVVSDLSRAGDKLAWTPATGNIRYAVYAIPRSALTSGNVLSAASLLGISYSATYDLPAKYTSGDTYTFAVSILDRYGNEFAPVLLGQAASQLPAAELTSPANDATVVLPTLFKWNPVSGADAYRLEISTEADFSLLIAAREVSENSFSSTKLFPMNEGQTYYWRVISRKVGAKDGISASRSFVANPFAITSPADGSQEMVLTPHFSWTAVGEDASYRIEIATNNTFANTVFSREITTSTLTLPESVLVGFTTYYARVSVVINGEEALTKVISFSTGEYIPGIPVIISPSNNEIIGGTNITVNWQNQPYAKSFRVELSKNPDFSTPRETKVKSTDAFVYQALYESLDPGTYYIRARSDYAAAYTGWSEVITAILNGGTGISTEQSLQNIMLVKDNQGNWQLAFYLDKPQTTSVELYNMSGLKIMSFAEQVALEGNQLIELPLGAIPNGVYLLTLKAGSSTKVLKLVK